MTTEHPSPEDRARHGAVGPWVTNLPNLSSLGGVLARSEFLRTVELFGPGAPASRLVALVIVDVDHFEWVNVAFGAAIGDRVLEHVALAMGRLAGPGSVVGRLDGDEFGVLTSVESETAALALAQEILDVVNAPVVMGTNSIQVTARAGVSVSGRRTDAVAAHLRYAKAALTTAKRAPASGPVMFTGGDRISVDRRTRIYRDLPGAFETRQLRVAYQPVVNLATGEAEGMEALARWRTLQGVDIPPGDFVPVAEEIGLIVPMGEWVLDEALYVASALSSIIEPPLTMAVNVSARQFAHPDLVGSISSALESHHVSASSLAIEVTETAAADDPRASATLQALRDLGCRVGIDDFGTGRSCLSYLRSLPVDFIKVDRSFVTELETDPRALRIVETIVAIARDLGLGTVAEGVETNGQRELATQAGCTHGQGYLFGRPAFHPELKGLLGHS